jgi:hypothetical protein
MQRIDAESPNYSHSDTSGFTPSVFRRVNSLDANKLKGLRLLSRSQIERFFILSSDNLSNNPSTNAKSATTKPKAKRTCNRKYVTYNNQFVHGGVAYEINASKSKKQGIYSPILHKAIEQLNICENRWRRVFVLFFNLHHAEYQKQNNKHISKFFNNLKKRLQRRYGFVEMGYLWVREKVKGQHYHCALFMDGNLVKHSNKVLEIAREAWTKLEPDKHHLALLKNSFYFVDNDSVKASAIYRLSYLCKTRGKGFRDNQVKDYSTSRLSALSI